MTTNPPLIIGLGSRRGVGKDTLYTAIRAVEPTCCRYAFADVLRADLADLLTNQFSIDVWDMTPEQKELVRPILIAYGMAKRAVDPDCWVRNVVEQIDLDMRWVPRLPIATDCRFVNEVTYMRAHYPGFKLVNLEREDAPPPTDEEEKHYRAVTAMADVQLEWGHDTEEGQRQIARGLLEQLRGL